MIARWRLDEGNKRAKKRYYAIYGREPIKSVKTFRKDRAFGMYRKTTRLCSCWMCQPEGRNPRDVRRDWIE